jgi:Carboxypeptidase regulatory-like domain
VKRIVFPFWNGSIILALGCGLVWAQATAQISGAARDQSGAVLPGVEVTVTRTDTGIARNTVTNETGTYVLPNLAIGPYRLEASLPGFRTYVQTGIVLQVNASPTIDVVMEVGQVAESVEVQAAAAQVETRSATVGQMVQPEQILELPLNGRNVNDLITLAGGAVAASETGERFAGASSPMIQVGGSAGYGVDYTLDGANHMAYVTGAAMVMPFPDATQEFKVETSGVTAERDRSAAVSVVTKSGTNQFHGDAFEFLRNDLFNATNYFAVVNPQTGKKAQSTLKRNQFGGTAGGPIVKNKLFFFGGYQGTIRHQDPQATRAFVPTAAVLAGDWTQMTSAACNNGRAVTLRAPFVNNRIDPARYSKAALGLVNWKGMLPFPITDDPCGAITFGQMAADHTNMYVGKIDYQQSEKHSVFGRVLLQRFDSTQPDQFNTEMLQNTGWKHNGQN